VKFSKVNRELHLITAQMRILPKKLQNSAFWGTGKNTNGLFVPTGSGPYIIDSIQTGKSISYKRNNKYWAVDHPTRVGMFNYDRIVVKYYKDQVVALEAFKAGEFDFISVNIAKQWARDMSGIKFETGKLTKTIFPHSNNAGIQGFVMNSRRTIFSDRRVRKALGLALDFEWTNRSLFHQQYSRNNSYFSNSTLAAKGLPTGLELEYLEHFRGSLPPEVFSEPLSAPVVKGKHGLRKNLLKAKTLLEDAGWVVKDGSLVNAKGEIFTFDILLVSKAFERVMAPYVKNLKKLGIQTNYRTIDSALYVDRIKTYDFDMIVASYGQSQSPGNEQRNFWHSSTAETEGARNYAGIQSDAVDFLVEKIIYADNREILSSACRALDRVLWYGYYLVPNWYLAVHRLAYNQSFEMPEKLPLYYSSFDLLMTWWKRE
jgi:microcin C transport system substrate-binding protein